MARILILDGYTRDARAVLKAGGATIAGELYAAMLTRCASFQVETTICFPSDPESKIPTGDALREFDAITWTGCSLSVVGASPGVEQQLDIARSAFALGIPSFGSCWAAQIGVVAAGGVVEVNARGREMGIGRKNELSDAGVAHPMYIGKNRVFDTFASHDDHITVLPAGTTCLAGNAWSAVQAVDISYQKGSFWAVQYHPEYNLHEMARLLHCRREKLIRLGFFRAMEDADRLIHELEALHADAGREDIAWQLGLDRDLLDEEYRTLEVRNWLTHMVSSRL